MSIMISEARGGWFDRLLLRARPDRKPSDQPASPVGAWNGTTRAAVQYQEVVLAEHALKHPVIYRCLQKISSSVASVNWYAEADPDVPTAEQAGAGVIKKLNAVLQSPSDVWTRQQLLSWMTMNFACYGRIPLKIGVGAVTPYVPTGIYPLTTRFFNTVRDSRGLVTQFTYGFGENSETLPIRSKAGDGKAYGYEIVRPNLDGTFESKNNMHPLGAIGLPAQIVTLLLQRAADTASGHPNTKYIVVCEKTLTKAQKTAITEQVLNMAPDGEASGQVLFLYNTAIKVEKLDNNLSDIHSKMPLDDMARQIIGAFGIPIALIGMSAADGAKFASNYAESREAFWLDTIIPEYLVPFATGMTAALCPYGARIRFDLDSIEAIIARRIANAERLAKVTYLTRDEKREITGWDPLPAGKGGDQLDFPPGSKDIANSGTAAPAPSGDIPSDQPIQ